MPLYLHQLQPGQQARIVGFVADQKDYRRKLLTMGLTPGTVITLARVAPLGDPVEIKVRGYALSLRKAEAAAMELESV